MAITNAQQFKQLVNPPMKGKTRPGYRGEAAAASAAASDRGMQGRSVGSDPQGRGDGPPTNDRGVYATRDPMSQFTPKAERIAREMLDAKMGAGDRFVPNFFPIIKGLANRFQVSKPTPFDIQKKGFIQALRPQAVDMIGGGGDGAVPYWAQLGFSSEAEYLASLAAQGKSTTEQEPEVEEPFQLSRRFRAEGGIMNADVVGGEFDFESARQMYGLGKLVKKVTRTVKKIAKSPVGKAAIAYGLFQGFKNPGVQKFLFGLPGGNPIVAPTKGILGVGGKFALGKGSLGVGTLIAGTSLAAGLLTADQEEEAQELARGEGIDIEAARNAILAARQDDFRARRFRAEGGRIGLRNGGDDDDADDQESSYDDGPLLIPDDADLSPDDFYGRKEREGIMKMASAPSLEDSINEMREMLARDFFGKPLGDLSDDELLQIDEMLENMSRIKKDSPSIKLAEGGKPEPVAKKTMPLLDMGGKEMDLREDGGFVPIGRMEKADDVPARLSKNEFVFTADAVRNAGDGDVDKGAEVMYNMMKNLESGGDVSEESQGLEGARKMFQTSQRLEEVL